MTPELSAKLWIAATATLTAVACSLVGVFLVLRRMALMGDAISHSVLPGLVLAFLLTGSLGPLPMVVGAAIFGVITALLIEALTRTGLVNEDAGTGVVFPAMFALGVLMLTAFADSVHLDAQCVLTGEIAFVAFNTISYGGVELGPRATWVMGGVTVLNTALMLAFWKQLQLSTFDPQLAEALGLRPGRVQYGLMVAVSLTAVAAFESVGAILVVALMTAPPATAYLLSHRLGGMVALSVVVAIASALGGLALAESLKGYNLSPAGCMATVAGAIFAGAWLAAPHHGLLARWLATRRQAQGFCGQLVLAALPVKLSGPDLPPSPPRGLTIGELARRFAWGESFTRAVVRRLSRDGLVHSPDGTHWVALPSEVPLPQTGPSQTSPLGN